MTSNMIAALAPRALKEPVREAIAEIRQAWEDQVHKSRMKGTETRSQREGTKVTASPPNKSVTCESRSHDLLVFDLDGTLVDSQRDLTEVGQCHPSLYGPGPSAAGQVSRYVGNGAPVLVQRALPDAGEEDWARAV